MTGRVLRASDQDRHEAVLALSDHFAEGRLDHDEFETRMSLAQQATYLHELDPLFADLPVRPTSPPALVTRAGVPARPGRPWLPVLPLVLGVAALVVVTHGHALWLLLPLWWLGLSARGHRSRHRDWPGRWQYVAPPVARHGVPPWHDHADRHR